VASVKEIMEKVSTRLPVVLAAEVRRYAAGTHITMSEALRIMVRYFSTCAVAISRIICRLCT